MSAGRVASTRGSSARRRSRRGQSPVRRTDGVDDDRQRYSSTRRRSVGRHGPRGGLRRSADDPPPGGTPRRPRRGRTRVVEPASVVGLVFAEDAIEHLIEARAGRRARPPAHPRRKQFVRPDRRRRRGVPVRPPAHPRHRVQGLLKRERVILHQRFVDWADQVNWLRGRETEFEEILGYHLEQAYRYRSELGPLDDGDRARYARLDAPRIGRTTCVGPRRLPAAANLLDAAARLLGERDAERPRLLVSAGEAYLEIGEFSKADEILSGKSGRRDHRGAPAGDHRGPGPAPAPPS